MCELKVVGYIENHLLKKTDVYFYECLTYSWEYTMFLLRKQINIPSELVRPTRCRCRGPGNHCTLYKSSISSRAYRVFTWNTLSNFE